MAIMVVDPVLMPDWLEKRRKIMGELDRQLIQGLETPGNGLTLGQLQAVTEHRSILMPAYPIEGVVFELTLDGDDPKNQPSEIMRWCERLGGRHYINPFVSGQQTRRFKLVKVGCHCQNLVEVRRRLGSGNVFRSQWINAFKTAFPVPDGFGPVGISCISWTIPTGSDAFMYVRADGGINLGWAHEPLEDYWRWLVAID